MSDTPVDQMTNGELDIFIGNEIGDIPHEPLFGLFTVRLSVAMAALQLLATEGREVRWDCTVHFGSSQFHPWCRVEYFQLLSSDIRNEVEYEEANPSLPLAIAKCVGKALELEARWRKESEADNE